MLPPSNRYPPVHLQDCRFIILVIKTMKTKAGKYVERNVSGNFIVDINQGPQKVSLKGAI